MDVHVTRGSPKGREQLKASLLCRTLLEAEAKLRKSSSSCALWERESPAVEHVH